MKTTGSSCLIAAIILSATSVGVKIYIGNAGLAPSNIPVLIKYGQIHVVLMN